MSYLKLTKHGRQGLIYVPVTVDGDGAITGLGTPVVINATADHKDILAAAAGAANNEVYSADTASGIKVEFPTVTTAIDGMTGAEKTGGSGGEQDKLAVTSLYSDFTFKSEWQARRGVLALWCMPLPKAPTSAGDGFAFLIGKLTSAIEGSGGPNAVGTIAMEVTGVSATATAGGVTAIESLNLASYTPLGETVAIDPPLLAAGDSVQLLKGEILYKQ